MSASWHWTPFKKTYILTFPHCHFRAVSQSYLRCCLLGCSPHLAPNLNSQLWSCTSFFSRQLWQLMKWARVDFLPATGLHWFTDLPYWLRFWVLLGGDAGYLPPHSRKDTRWGPSETPEHTHSWSRQRVGLSWKIPRNSHPGRRHWVGGWLKDARGITHPVERYWVGGAQLREKKEEYPGAGLKDAEVALL